MIRQRVLVLGAALAFCIAFLFLVPVVSYPFPPGLYAEQPSHVKYGSITYWAFGAGGTWRYIGHGGLGYTTGYSVSVASSAAPPVLGPAPLLGYVSTQGLSCSLSTGVCSMTIVSSVSVPLEVEACQVQVILSANSTNTTWHLVNGTVGGQAASGIPPNSRVGATCAVPTSDLSQQKPGYFQGLQVSGTVRVRLTSAWESYSAGTETSVSFAGSWS